MKLDINKISVWRLGSITWTVEVVEKLPDKYGKESQYDMGLCDPEIRKIFLSKRIMNNPIVVLETVFHELEHAMDYLTSSDYISSLQILSTVNRAKNEVINKIDNKKRKDIKDEPVEETAVSGTIDEILTDLRAERRLELLSRNTKAILHIVKFLETNEKERTNVRKKEKRNRHGKHDRHGKNRTKGDGKVRKSI